MIDLFDGLVFNGYIRCDLLYVPETLIRRPLGASTAFSLWLSSFSIISANYKTSAPSSTSHAIVAKGVAEDLLNRILK